MKTILVVDDSKTYLTLAKQALEPGYQVVPVLSGMQALKFLEKRRPDLILLDINMPEMDGRETMREMKRSGYGDIPVIFLTASAEPETEVACLELGATDFIAKPFVPQVMRVRIARTLELEEYRRAAEQKAKRFENIASTDALTGLWNRSYLSGQIAQLLDAGHGIAYLMVDVDHFKSVNDRFGHIMGDTVLRQLADLLREGFPDGLVGRVGGDEFVVVLQDPPERSVLAERVGALQQSINAGFLETTQGIATTSIGIAEAPRNGTDYRSLYDCADKALYLVKNEGKNGFRFFDVQTAEHPAQRRMSAGIQTDIALLHRQINEQGEIRGAYWQEYEPFLAIYRFMLREISRRKSFFTLVLLTIRTAEGQIPAPEPLNAAMEQLHSIIQNSIRKEDVFTAYSSAQYLILLPATQAAAAEEIILARIAGLFAANEEMQLLQLEHETSFFSPEELPANLMR